MSAKRTRRKARATRRLLYVAILASVVLVGANFVRVTAQARSLDREVAGIGAEIAVLAVQQAALREQLAVRQTDAYVEQKAHELGYVRPGEGLASLRDRSSTPSSSASASGLDTRLDRWLALFFHP